MISEFPEVCWHVLPPKFRDFPVSITVLNHLRVFRDLLTTSLSPGFPEPLPGGSCVGVCSAPVFRWRLGGLHAAMWPGKSHGEIPIQFSGKPWKTRNFLRKNAWLWGHFCQDFDVNWCSIIVFVGNYWDISIIPIAKYGPCKARISGSHRSRGTQIMDWCLSWNMAQICEIIENQKLRCQNGSWTDPLYRSQSWKLKRGFFRENMVLLTCSIKIPIYYVYIYSLWQSYCL